MRTRTLTIPEIALIAGTRAALGAGVGLLLAGRLSDRTRRGAGRTLVAIGALSTIPILFGVLGGPRDAGRRWGMHRARSTQRQPVKRDGAVIETTR